MDRRLTWEHRRSKTAYVRRTLFEQAREVALLLQERGSYRNKGYRDIHVLSHLVIRDDGSEIRQPHGMSRVMFESGTPELVRDLTMIFNEGILLKEAVSGREIRERDNYDVVVTIFPSQGVK